MQFHVDEETDLLPCIFDNFVWFSDDEIIADLRGHVPFFDVLLPPGGDIIGHIREELARFVAAKNIPAEVGYIAYTSGIGQPVSQHIFQADGIELPIRAIHFSGVNEKFLGALNAASKQLMQQDYSRLTTIQYEHASLLPVYQEKGYLRAEFGVPKIESIAASKKIAAQDVVISIPVEEGRIYNWGGADWRGVLAFPPEKLTDGLGQRLGEPANLIKFNGGLDAARQLYEKFGYLESQIRVKQVFEESSGSVTFDITVAEGDQFRMGALTISGVPDRIAESLRGAWKLKAGDIFNGSYFAEFVGKEVPSRIKGLAPRAGNVRESLKLDHENHRVDVTLNF